MNSNAEMIYLDIKSKLHTNYNRIVSDNTFLENQVDTLITLAKKAMKHSFEVEELVGEEKREKSLNLQKEIATQQVELLKSLHLELAPARHEIIKILAALTTEEYSEISYELLKEEAQLALDFNQKLMEVANPKIIKELDTYANELEDEYDNTEYDELKFLGKDELIN